MPVQAMHHERLFNHFLHFFSVLSLTTITYKLCIRPIFGSIRTSFRKCLLTVMHQLGPISTSLALDEARRASLVISYTLVTHALTTTFRQKHDTCTFFLNSSILYIPCNQLCIHTHLVGARTSNTSMLPSCAPVIARLGCDAVTPTAAVRV
jgi:hypothetical protein